MKPKPNKVHTEDEIMVALKKLDEGRYFLAHPSLPGARPDALTVGLNDGFEVRGYEIKRSRADWMSELRYQKNSTSRLYCDYWFIVALEGVVKLDDLPSGWGLYVVHKGPTLELECDASRITSPGVFDRGLAYRILRHILSDIPKDEWTDRAYKKGYEKAVADLLDLEIYHTIDGRQLAKIISAMHERPHFKLVEQLKELRVSAADILESVDSKIAELPAIRDWETGKSLPPKAIKYIERIREMLLEKHPSFRSLSKNQLDQILHSHARAFMRGQPVIF